MARSEENQMLATLVEALRLKDVEQELHAKRVATFSAAIAKAMGVSASESADITRGAFVHDIGNLGIPDAILHKPGPLSLEEAAAMQKHCLYGYNLLRTLPFCGGFQEAVYAHHEKYDGTGYPRGLKGEDIPLGARVCAVADALDSITSDRPHRKSKLLVDATAEIERCSGTQFDPKVVEALKRMLVGIGTEGWYELHLPNLPH
jgi:HD-GYP domain-containing protein (c-di-GMP phosphodiesterase class II)